ncbi:SCO0930 family lipoprotein [Streptomyces sp. Wb2n-11]|uniref:SCO0930 family lipoprotein n=1 Tax=Streptomyces sp. Wb2n-11 TaxID=1030533 RepID=UPI000A7F5924|nr:SCO0930 family lipoprotein [Streptomyces sp. Wb2n-11]
MKTWRNVSLAVTAATVMVLTAACGQDRATESPNGQSVGNANPARQPAGNGYGSGNGYTDAPGGQAAAPRAAGRLAVWDSEKLGKVVTDSRGFTLYRFDKDTASPPKSNCDGDCAKAWPVVPAGDATAAPGTDASALGEVVRADGAKQLTIGGRPMYRFAKDTGPGDAKGQGVGGTWFASAPDGKKAAPGAADGTRDDAAENPSGLAGMSVREDPDLGDVVVDSKGMTVYRFKKDSAWPMRTACTGACLDKWPVVPPVGKNDTDGILKKGFVVFDRPDGVQQQTIDCWPVYTFSGDVKPGDTNGQGVGGTWYAVSPEGKLVGAPA